jgi:hypothetical protein
MGSIGGDGMEEEFETQEFPPNDPTDNAPEYGEMSPEEIKKAMFGDMPMTGTLGELFGNLFGPSVPYTGPEWTHTVKSELWVYDVEGMEFRFGSKEIDVDHDRRESLDIDEMTRQIVSHTINDLARQGWMGGLARREGLSGDRYIALNRESIARIEYKIEVLKTVQTRVGETV